MRKISGPVKMRFIDAPIGCLFKYDLKTEPVWIKINPLNCGFGLIAEYNQDRMQEPLWRGQIVCSFAFEKDKELEREIFVIG